MKKFLAILVLGLLWCNVGFALSQQQAIDQYLSGRSLDPVEGIWIYSNTGTVTVVYKNQDRFIIRIISSKNASSGEYDGSISKGSSTIYYGEGVGIYAGGQYTCQLTRTLISENETRDRCTNVTIGDWSRSVLRIWPEDIKLYNANIDNESESTVKWKKIATALDGTITSYVDIQSMKKRNDRVFFTQLDSLKEAIEVNELSAYSAINKNEGNCANNKTRFLKSVYYSQNMAKGNIISTDGIVSDWSYNKKNSVMGLVLEYVCSKAKPKDFQEEKVQSDSLEEESEDDWF